MYSVLHRILHFQAHAPFPITVLSNIIHYVRLNMTTLFRLKDHQTGVDIHWSQVIQDPKLAVHASGAESWTVCLTTQIDVSMAWAFWGAFLGELSRTGCFGSPNSCGTFGVTDGTVSQNWNVAGGVSLKVCDSSCTLSSVRGMPNNIMFQELIVSQLSGSLLYHSHRYA